MFTRASLLVCIVASAANAFVIPTGQPATKTSTQLAASRRDFFAGAAAVVGAAVLNAAPAEASYSAFAAREKDWDERTAKGDIQVSTARSLRKQLKEFVPANNDARSKIFCPNGEPSNVSPLMENKCSDVRMALPSVYGRTQDSVGNSIPGFEGGYKTGETSSLSASTGGFPKY